MGHEVDGADAGTVIVAALVAIGARIDELAPAALADEPDAVHQLRTHVRRLRSVLAAYAPLFDAAMVEGLRRRYRELGRELGTVRDIEVRMQVAERALQEASEMPEASAARARLVDDERGTYRLAHARFAQRQRMPRAGARRASLAEFVDAPPFTPHAAEPAIEVLGDLLAREARRAVEQADSIDGSAGAEQLHRLRKAGRRLRYASEAVTEEPIALFGDRAEALAQAGEGLHDVLGDHRDDVLFAEHVRRAAAHSAHEGAPVDLFNRLAKSAERRAEHRLDELAAVVADLHRAERLWASR